MPKEKPTSLRMPDDVKRGVRKYAKAQGCSMSFKMVEILRDGLARLAEQEKMK